MLACVTLVPTTVNAQQRQLSRDDVRRWASLLRAADARLPDSAAIMSALASPASALRAAGALTIGQVRAASMAPTLRTLLTARDTAVAAAAAYALGLLRDSASVPALAGSLRGSIPVAVEAAWALGQIGAPARASLEQALTAGSPRDDRVTGALLLAASKLRPVPVEWATRHFTRANPEIRWRAAYVIARPFAAAGVRALLPLAADTEPLVRANVARALSRAAAGDSLRGLALPLLDSLARDPHPHVRINAVRSLGTYGTAARAPLLTALRDRDANVRVAAAQSVGEALDPHRELWGPLWEADTGFMFRRSLLASAMQAGLILSAAEPPGARGWAESADWRHRAAVAEAAGASPSAERRRIVALPLTRDDDPRVRAAAYDALSGLVDSVAHPWARQAVYGAFDDDDVSVRAGAIGALLDRASAADLPRVLDAYGHATRDTVNDARITALRFIAAAWRRDSTAVTDSVRVALAALPVPRDPLERAAISGVTPLAAWERTLRTPLHPLEWYEARVRELIVPALAGRLPRAEVETERGRIVLELFALDAPLTVRNFVTLAGADYYSGVRFHRVVPNFVAQDGDRRGDGNGGPAYAIRDELNRRRYDRGAVGMALSGPDTGGSQYFLTLSPQPHLDGGYTVFGHVVSGLDVMDALVQGDRIDAVRVRR